MTAFFLLIEWWNQPSRPLLADRDREAVAARSVCRDDSDAGDGDARRNSERITGFVWVGSHGGKPFHKNDESTTPVIERSLR
jgi:hypothetical protein